MFYKKFYHIFFTIARKNMSLGAEIRNSRADSPKRAARGDAKKRVPQALSEKNKKKPPVFLLT